MLPAIHVARRSLANEFDLSNALGISDQFKHYDFRAVVARIEQAASKTGIPLGGR
jgi:hypothetical protein